MPDSIGLLNKMGISSVANWTDAFTAVTAYVPFIDETLTSNFERSQQQELVGQGGRLPSYQSNRVTQGTTKHHLDYDTWTLITAVLGNVSAGTISIVDRLTSGSSKYFWLEFDKGHIRHRFGAAKPMKLRIAIEKNGIVGVDADWYCRSFEASATAMASLTMPVTKKVLFKELTFRLGDQVDALNSGDDLGVENFELVLDRTAKADDYAMNATAAVAQLPLEVLENDFRVVSLSAKIPRYAADSIVTWKQSDTALQATIYGTSSDGTFTIKMPNLRIVDGFNANIGGPGPLSQEGSLELYRSTNTSHPMHPGVTMNEFEIVYT
jgi:hypothetical protein